MITLEPIRSMAALGPEWDEVFATAPSLQSTRLWFEVTEQAALPPATKPLILALRRAGKPIGLLPLGTAPGNRCTSLTSPYTILFQPLLPATDAQQAAQAIGQALRRHPTTRLDALDPAWPGLSPFLAGLRRSFLLARPFDHFGNWHQPGLHSWEAYLATRPGALRETIRRRTKAAARDPTIRFEVIAGPEGLAPAMQAYESVYARSWKVPEPFPTLNATLLPRLAAVGALRLGLLWRGPTPVAAQYWTIERRQGQTIATVLKLAHDDAAKDLSPGTLLTAHMIRSLLAEGTTELDFGRGDDDYKQLWTSQRRQRIGLMLANPRRAGGLAEIARSLAAQARRKLRRG